MEEKEYEGLQKCLREIREAAAYLNKCTERLADMLYTAESYGCDWDRDCEQCYYYYRGECALRVRKKRSEDNK